MSRPLHRTIIHGRRAALIFGLALAAAHAQADQDTLYVTAQADSMSTAGDGGGAAVEWQRTLSDRAGINLGALSYSLAGSRWTYGKVIGHLKAHEKATLYGEIDGGAGRREGEGFTYQVYKAGMITTLVAGRLFLDLEDQYLHVDVTKENLVKGGVVVVPVPSLTAAVSYYVSTAGTADSRFLSGRLDTHGRRTGSFAGFTVGRSSPERFNIITSTDEAQHSNELYVGTSIPAGSNMITLVLDRLRIADETKHTFSVTWKLPLHAARPPGPAQPPGRVH